MVLRKDRDFFVSTECIDKCSDVDTLLFSL